MTDYKGGGRHKLSFIRYYNSAASYTGDMGIGWRHNFSRSFDILTSTKRTASRETGQEFIFNKSGSNWNPADTNIVLRVAVSGTNFILIDADNVKETYDTNGVLQTIENPDGYTQTLNYTSGRLTSVSDNLGRTLTFAYNADDFLETVTDPDGNVYSYAYIDAYTTPDGAKKLSTVTYPDNTPSPTDNPVITYHYENTDYPTYMTGITDPLGHRYATWTYDANGQALSSEHADGADETTITYNSDGTKTVTQPLGGQTKYTFSVIKNAPMVTREDRLATGSVPAAFQLYTYDGNGFPASFTDWKGNVTKYTYNTRGLETSRTEAFGTAQARTIGTTWSTAFRLPAQITRTGLTTDMAYDSNGNLLTYVQIDTQTQTIPYSTNGATRQWTYTYDGMGNVLTVNGPRTDVTDTTTYDYASTTKNLEKITDALGHETTITSYNGNGLPLSLTDPNGLVVDLAYDAQGRLTQYTLKAVAGDQVTQIDYNLAGLVTKITAPDASTLEYAYDDAQRLVAVENNVAERIEYTLDDAGNIIKEEIKNSGGTIRKKMERQFDEISRLIKDIGAASAQETAYQYDANGNRTAITDARSNTTTQAFDALNRLITVTDPLTHSATTGYDARDNVTSQSDWRSLSTSYVYNGFNQVIQKTSPDTGTIVYMRDKAGNAVSETDARGVVVNRTFDVLDRTLTETYPAYGSENITYSYDAITLGNKGIGRLTGFTDQSGSTILKYDDVGNMVETTRTISGQAYTTAYEYDAANRITRITYPSGRQVNYTYSSYGTLTMIATKPNAGGASTTLASSVTFEPFGPLKSFIYGNGLSRVHSFDQNYWLTAIVTEDGATHIQDLEIAYDNAGYIESIDDNLDPARNQDFQIDAVNRITQADGDYGTIDYTYDANSNRLTRVKGGVTQTSTYPVGSNKLSGINDGTNTRSFVYSNAGNITSDDRATSADIVYTYGGRNRLQSVSVGGSTVATYLVNARGERVSKTAGGVTTHYHYDENGYLIAETDNTGVVIHEYVWMDDMPVAQIDDAGAIAYIHTDHLNTPQKMTDAAQAVIWDRQQEVFGETHAISGSGLLNLRFPGQYADAEDGLFYNLMRDYDPTLGRYIEADPIGQQGGLNLYTYANQNPLNYFDPQGLAAAACALPGSYGCGTLEGGGILPGLGGRIGSSAKGLFLPGTVIGADLAGISTMAPPSDPADDAKAEAGDADNCVDGNPEPESDEEWCKKIRERCREECLDTYVDSPNTLPGIGSDRRARLKRCVRHCAERHGCFGDYTILGEE